MVSANRNEPLTPAFAVSLTPPKKKPDDKKVAWDVMPWIGSVSVTNHVREIGTFTLELTSREDEHGIKIWSDDERFELGASVAVRLGYGKDLETLIAGEITGLQPSFSIGGAPTLTVFGKDMRHKLETGAHLREAFILRRYSEIVEEICKDNGIDVQALPTLQTKTYALLPLQTDLAVLQQLADEIHYELAWNWEKRTLLFRPIETNKTPVATLTLGDDLLSFQPSMGLVPITRLQMQGVDLQNKKPLSVSRGDEHAPGVPGMRGTRSPAEEAERIVGESVELLPTAEVSTQPELEYLGDARYREIALDYITGGGTCRGHTGIRAGEIISIDGIGKKFSGDYYVESATHSFGREQGYVTTFRTRRNAA